MTKTSLALSSNVCGNGSICWPSGHVEHMGSEWLETPTLKPAKGRGISGAPAKRCRFMVDECSHKVSMMKGVCVFMPLNLAALLTQLLLGISTLNVLYSLHPRASTVIHSRAL